MGVADEDLRHGAPPGDLHHVIALPGVGVDPDFLDLLDAFGFQNLFGPNAIGADAR